MAIKVGVVSDVHGNVEALTYALEQLAACELVLCLGDLVSDYSVPPAILRVARDKGLVGIAGNHEKSILIHPGSTLRNRLAADDLAYLRGLPAQRDLAIDGRRVLVAHGAPWDNPNSYQCQYVTVHDKPLLARIGEGDHDVVLLGHTHRPMSVPVNGTLVLNPGTCGESRDAAIGLTYAELDFGRGLARTFEIRAGGPPVQILGAEF
jgi:putative phosphoesterase